MLKKQEDGTYVVKNGPFMRKFFDGYFPMRVSIDMQLPPELHYLGIEPRGQDGFNVVLNGNKLELDAWFEGRLITKIRLGSNR